MEIFKNKFWFGFLHYLYNVNLRDLWCLEQKGTFLTVYMDALCWQICCIRM